MSFTSLPPELIEEILILCDPIDVSAVARTCQDLRNLVYDPQDDSLWRGLYLSQLVDDPRTCVAPDGRPRPPIKWKFELQRLIRARELIRTRSVGRPGEIGTVLRTLVDLVSFVPPLLNGDISSSLSMSLVWIAVLVRNGWIDLVESQALATHERQLVTRFHTHYGLTQNDTRKGSRAASRAFVYNMYNYSYDNDFGPFLDDKRVNWVHVQAIHHVVSMHVVLSTSGEQELDPDNFEFAVYPLSLSFTQIAEPKSDAGNDWAGVNGEWSVSFCFCDHRVLLAYNEEIHEAGLPSDISTFEKEEFQEIFRCMKVDLQVMRTEDDPERPDTPVIFFAGIMKDINQSIMSGKVWMGSDGFVRWRFISGEQNNAIWSSEGVQIGGLRSSYGVLGAWTTVFHDSDDPVGPFWLRKEGISSTVPVSTSA